MRLTGKNVQFTTGTVSAPSPTTFYIGVAVIAVVAVLVTLLTVLFFILG